MELFNYRTNTIIELLRKIKKNKTLKKRRPATNTQNKKSFHLNFSQNEGKNTESHILSLQLFQEKIKIYSLLNTNYIYI